MVLQKGWNKIVLVTDIYCTRRSVRTFQKVLKGVQIYSSPAANCNYHVTRWLEKEAGFTAVFDETIKVSYYLFRYGVWPV